MCKVIAIGNNKGGVAKTTTAVNLAKGLADAGKRVLLIDADPQGNATAAVGYDEPDLIEDNLAKVIVMERKDIEIEPGYGILHNKGGFDVLPGNIELSEVELEIMSAMHRESILDLYVTMMRPMYDYIIIDCAPSLGLLTTNAFVAADSILIPVQASYLPIKGLEQLVRHITQIKKHINFDLYIEGILLTMVDARTNMAKRVIDTIQGAYGSKVKMFSMNIPRSVKADESIAEGVSIYEYDSSNPVAEAYRSLTSEVLADE